MDIVLAGFLWRAMRGKVSGNLFFQPHGFLLCKTATEGGRIPVLQTGIPEQIFPLKNSVLFVLQGQDDAIVP